MNKITFFLITFLISTAFCKEMHWIVWDINFIGNKSFDKSILINQMQLKPQGLFRKTEFSSSQLDQDINQLKDFYQNRGFFETEITSDLVFDSSNSKVTINLTINEGIQTVIDSVIFVGNIIYDSSYLSSLTELESGKILDSSLYTAAQSSILEFLASQGRLFARIEHFFVFDSSGKKANLIFTINEGPVLKTGDLEILGLNRTQDIVLKRELLFKPGQVITAEKIRSSIRNLYATGLFKLINILPVDTLIYPYEADSVIVPVLIQVEEANFLDVRFGGGYNSIDKWYLALELAYKNLFGKAHRISLSSRVSNIVLQAQVDYTYPWIFGKDFSSDISAYIERRDLQSFTGFYQGGLLALNGNFGFENRYRIWTSFQHTEWLKGVPQGQGQEQNNTLLFGTSFTRDTRISILDPGNAYFGFLQAEVAGPAISWSNQFYRIETDIRGYLKFFNKLNFSSALFLGYVTDFGKSDLVPPSELLRIGIDNVRPIRGYIEQDVSPTNNKGEATGGKLALVVNLFNLRFPFYYIISGEFFIDGGYVWPDFNDFNLKNARWSSGPGLLINLPSAIFRIDYGFKLDRSSGLDGGWYFGIGYAF